MVVGRPVAVLPVVVAASLAIAALWKWWRRNDDDDDKDEDVSRLVRPNIRRLAPYRCARDDYSTGVLLDANENAFGGALGDDSLSLEASAMNIHRYPDPLAGEVRAGMARLRGVDADNIFVGVGSDEAIDILFRVFCEPRRSSILIMPPTYGMYKVCAAANDVSVVEAPLDESFDVDVGACCRVARRSTRLVFVTSPGNPTSALVSKDRVLQLHDKIPNALVVVDEAYVDCSSAPTMAPLVADYPRLVVLHTLSKAFGLAGARVGTAIARPDVVRYMNNLKAPYNVNALTAKLAAAALSKEGVAAMHRNVHNILQERKMLVQQLAVRSFVERVHRSDANFLLVKVTPAHLAYPLYKGLADRKHVVVRYRGDQANCTGCLRVTVGTPEENAALLAALDDLALTIAAGL